MSESKDIFHKSLGTGNYAFTDSEHFIAAQAKAPILLKEAANSSIWVLSSSTGVRVVQVFYRDSPELAERFSSLFSTESNQTITNLIGDVEFEREGLRAGSSKFPILKSHWHGGLHLKRWASENLDRPDRLLRVAAKLWKLAEELCASGVAHGDLVPMNIYVTSSETLRLIEFENLAINGLSLEPNERVDLDPRDTDQLRCLEVYLSLCALACFPSRLSMNDNSSALINETEFLKSLKSLQQSTLPGLALASTEYRMSIDNGHSGLRLSDLRQRGNGSAPPGLAMESFPLQSAQPWRYREKVVETPLPITKTEHHFPVPAPINEEPEPDEPGKSFGFKAILSIVAMAVIITVIVFQGDSKRGDGTGNPPVSGGSTHTTGTTDPPLKKTPPGRKVPQPKAKITVVFGHRPQDLQEVDSFFLTSAGDTLNVLETHAISDSMLSLEPGTYGYGFIGASGERIETRPGGFIVSENVSIDASATK